MRPGRLVTVFIDTNLENELRLRDHFNKFFVPNININERVKSVRFEYITEGLLYGKVLGKKAYKVQVPQSAYNAVLNSWIDLSRVRINDVEHKIQWPSFYFANPDKVKVKVKELRKKQRKEQWKGKTFKSIFWDWMVQ